MVGALCWLAGLNFHLTFDWRPWHIVGQRVYKWTVRPVEGAILGSRRLGPHFHREASKEWRGAYPVSRLPECLFHFSLEWVLICRVFIGTYDNWEIRLNLDSSSYSQSPQISNLSPYLTIHSVVYVACNLNARDAQLRLQGCIHDWICSINGDLKTWSWSTNPPFLWVHLAIELPLPDASFCSQGTNQCFYLFLAWNWRQSH